MSASGAESSWQSWLLPERPGLKQFLLGALALMLPVPAMALGKEQIIPAMALSVTIGGGLGLGWAILYARDWFARSPLNAVCVFAATFGCLLHLALMPRWEVGLRAMGASAEIKTYLATRRQGRTAPVPNYDSGPYSLPFRVLELPSLRDRTVVAYTPEPLRRWTPFGYRDSVVVVLHADGSSEFLWSSEQREAFLAANQPTRP